MKNQVEVLGHKMLTNPEDRIISYRLRRGIIYEQASVNSVKKNLKKGQTFVNVGAHIGYFTLIMAHIVGQEGHGYSFEPDPVNFSFLERNIKLNGYKNITLEQCAIGDLNGTANLYLNNMGNQGDHRIWEDEKNPREKLPVKIMRLDDYFKDTDEQVDFLKIDVQGSEAKVFEGMKDILFKTKGLKILMELWPWGLRGCGSDPLEMVEDLLDCGFYSFDILKNGSLQSIDVIKALTIGPNSYKHHKNIWWQKEI